MVINIGYIFDRDASLLLVAVKDAQVVLLTIKVQTANGLSVVVVQQHAAVAERAFIATRRKVHAYSLEKRPLTVERRTARWLTLRFGENRIRHQWFGHMLTTNNPISRYLYAPRFDAIPLEPIASLLNLSEA